MRLMSFSRNSLFVRQCIYPCEVAYPDHFSAQLDPDLPSLDHASSFSCGESFAWYCE